MTADPGHLFCFGLGYCSQALARTLQAEGWRISGTCREPERQARLRSRGITAHLFDREHLLEDIEAAFAGVTHVLHSIPPDDGGDPVLHACGVELAQLPGLQWFGYMSTSGVYGDRGGDWVDEDSELKPTGERGRRRAAAEAGWNAMLSLSYFPLHIFRLAGIYFGCGLICLWAGITVRQQGTLVILIGLAVFLAGSGRLLSMSIVGLPDPPAVWLGYLVPELLVPWIMVGAQLATNRRMRAA